MTGFQFPVQARIFLPATFFIPSLGSIQSPIRHGMRYSERVVKLTTLLCLGETVPMLKHHAMNM
jgi:hypothetical protein